MCRPSAAPLPRPHDFDSRMNVTVVIRGEHQYGQEYAQLNYATPGPGVAHAT
jgi:hypothetical protein